MFLLMAKPEARQRTLDDREQVCLDSCRKRDHQVQSEQTSLDTFKPGLAAFGLHVAELASLAEQGFVATELRNGRVYYKLRFRIGTRQCVWYLGTDPVLVA